MGMALNRRQFRSGSERTAKGTDTPWRVIRLELARTPDFPEGSASRAYLLRLPLNERNLIDEHTLRGMPSLATARRYWPNEPDMSGYVVKTSRGWAISYAPGEDDDETVFHLETHPLSEGEYITLTEPDGQQLPFKIASVLPLS
jgi:hypothetical protein